jgi:hypothetical protein
LALAAGACGKDKKDDAATGSGKSGGTGDVKDRVEAEIAKKVPGAVGAGADQTAFGVESAKITYELTGFETGTVTAWFTDHGKTVVMVYDMTKPMPEKKTIVWKDAKTTMWSVAPEKKAPYTTGLRIKDTELRLISTLDPKQLEMAGYEKKPNESIAGQDCEVWSHPKTNVTVWRWQGVDLKYINGVLGKNPQTRTATEVVTPTTIPADVMTPPA